MLSLFLRDPDRRPEHVAGALLKALRLLLDGFAAHAVRGDAAPYEKLRARLREISGKLEAEPSASATLFCSGAVSQALEEYQESTSEYFRSRTDELQRIAAQLTAALCAIAPAGSASAAKLRAIQENLAAAKSIQDFQSVRIRMAECLEALREEAERQRGRVARQVAELRETVNKLRSSAGATAIRQHTDPVTGLDERAGAEAAMLEAAADERPLYAAVFVVTQAPVVNARYGRQIGDEVLRFYAAYLARSLSRTDRLFRWTGPAFLALLEREQPGNAVREEIAGFADRRLSKTVVVDGRSVVLPVAGAWTILSLAEIRPLQELIRRIEAFAMAPAARAPAAAPA